MISASSWSEESCAAQLTSKRGSGKDGHKLRCCPPHVGALPGALEMARDKLSKDNEHYKKHTKNNESINPNINQLELQKQAFNLELKIAISESKSWKEEN